MLYFSPFCLNLVYVNVYVPKLGGGVVPKSDVYNYSDPIKKAESAENEHLTAAAFHATTIEPFREHCSNGVMCAQHSILAAALGQE